jgi:hypothetical protein
MGSAKQIVYRFEGRGIADEMAILDTDGDARVTKANRFRRVFSRGWHLRAKFAS